MKKIFSAVILLFSLSLAAQLQSPPEFLPGYGSNVTYYGQLESYFAQLVKNSAYIQYKPYGLTPEGRNLNAYYISTPDNLKNLEAIRQSHLYQAGLQDTVPVALTDKIIIWLSFNVHGNEPAAAESAMNIAYELVNPLNTATKEWLQNTVVILDPCLNPDGFSHYGNWLHSIAGSSTHPLAADREHMEPWPGGRENHYAYDLNRDWAWQVQPETRQRMALYNKWMPMVHVDVHEMGYNDPYFFPPPAEPMHDYITPGQKDFYEAIGEMNAKKFDANGWSYFTREVYDLFYPSYGDTYPSFNGAVGMTFEQGGIGAGRAVQLSNGTTLTLQDRIDHHTAAVLTAIETAAWQKEKLIKNFRAYFKDSRDKPKGKYRTYIVKNNGRNEELARLLTRNCIQFAYAGETKKLSGYHYQSDKDKDFVLEPNDLIVSINQPKAMLTQVLFEPQQHLSDSLSYDITAWALPFAYGSESYAIKKDLQVVTKKEAAYKGKFEFERVYAYYIPWNGRASARVLSQLHKNNVQVRCAQKASLYRGIKVSPGDLVVLKGDNAQLTDFAQSMNVLLEGKRDYEVIESGFSITGGDLGGESYPLLKAPKVLLLSGNGVSTTDFGQAWYFMDEIIDYPVSIIDIPNLGRINFSDFTTIILADGSYILPDTDKARLDTFINGGGKVIAMGNALSLFEDRAGYALTKYTSDAGREQDNQLEEKESLDNITSSFENVMRHELSSSLSGAIVQNSLDPSHPLCFGLGSNYYSLKTSSAHYQLLKNAQNVIYVPQGYKSFGFIGSSLKKKLANTVTFAVELKGEGTVIYMVDNPLFRGFWENGNLLFSNALFLVK